MSDSRHLKGRRSAFGFWHRTSLAVVAAGTLSLAACGGGSSTPATKACAPGIISGYNKSIDNTPIANVSSIDNEGIGGDSGGDGAVGIGIGGADGQYRHVDVTVETADGRTFGPKAVDESKGMVTFVGCDAELPAKVTFEGTDVNAIYYDEGLKSEVSFFNKRRIGLVTAQTKNAGVTPLSHALYDRTMELGRLAGNAQGWKSPALINQAQAELLPIVNQQLPEPYLVKDLSALPIALNAANDSPGSNSLADSENGVLGAVLAGLAKTAKVTLPQSASPALEIADVLIADLVDAKLDLKDVDGALIRNTSALPYTYDTLWTQTSVSTGETAGENGAGALRTSKVVIAYVRGGAQPTQSDYVLRSNGELVVVLNPTVNGGSITRPAPGVKFSEVMGFGEGLPVVALRRDGTSVLVFTAPGNGSVFTEVFSPTTPASGTIVELMDGGSPVIRTSNGKFWRLNQSSSPLRFDDEPAPDGVVNFTFRPEYAGALAPGDAELGADPNGAADNGLCIGAALGGQVKLWRPVFAPGDSVLGRSQSVLDIVQVSSDQSISLGLDSNKRLFHLDADHTVASSTLALSRPGSDPIPVTAPDACWIEAPYFVACNGDAYQVQYPTFTDGTATRAGAISGIAKLPIASKVWRTRSNRGADLVFLGTDGLVYEPGGQVLSLPE